MATTYTLISSNVLSSSAASVTFSSIPATYTDLVLRISARTNDTGPENLQIYFNTDTSTNYSTTMLQGDGASATSARYTSQTVIQNPNTVEGTTYTSNTFGSIEIYIPSYTSSANKPVSLYGASENNATTAYINAGAGLWRGSAAITQIVIDQSGANFVSGSSFYLYGISNA